MWIRWRPIKELPANTIASIVCEEGDANGFLLLLMNKILDHKSSGEAIKIDNDTAWQLAWDGCDNYRLDGRSLFNGETHHTSRSIWKSQRVISSAGRCICHCSWDSIWACVCLARVMVGRDLMRSITVSKFGTLLLPHGLDGPHTSMGTKCLPMAGLVVKDMTNTQELDWITEISGWMNSLAKEMGNLIIAF